MRATATLEAPRHRELKTLTPNHPGQSPQG
jgi:hypothetical protein